MEGREVERGGAENDGEVVRERRDGVGRSRGGTQRAGEGERNGE
mgnify:CR=1 FL=1